MGLIFWCVICGFVLGVVIGGVVVLLLVFGKADQHDLPVTVTKSESSALQSDPEGWEKYFGSKPPRCNGACKITDAMMTSCSECGWDDY